MGYVKQSNDLVQANNEIIAYVSHYAVVRNEWGNLYVVEQPEEAGAIGEVVESKYLIPIEQLPHGLQKKIKQVVE